MEIIVSLQASQSSPVKFSPANKACSALLHRQERMTEW